MPILQDRLLHRCSAVAPKRPALSREEALNTEALSGKRNVELIPTGIDVSSIVVHSLIPVGLQSWSQDDTVNPKNG